MEDRACACGTLMYAKTFTFRVKQEQPEMDGPEGVKDLVQKAVSM